VYPVTHTWTFSGERLALRDLVLVVREDQIGATTMYIYLRAQVVQRQNRALAFKLTT